MSRIGKKPIKLAQGVTVEVKEGNLVTVKGPKGELTKQFSPIFDIQVREGEVEIVRPNDEKETKMFHGTERALLNNMIIGVEKGFTKELMIVGTGYKAQATGKSITLTVGYSHDVTLNAPAGVEVKCPSPTAISVSGISKEVVGQFCAEIRAVREPEPYKGKGIRYNGEVVRQKVGKKTK